MTSVVVVIHGIGMHVRRFQREKASKMTKKTPLFLRGLHPPVGMLQYCLAVDAGSDRYRAMQFLDQDALPCPKFRNKL